MRILIAGLIGGTLLWLWGAVAHMVLPIGEMGMKTAVDQDAAIAALQASATSGNGVYFIPGMSPEQWSDPQARDAFVAKYDGSPYAMVVYRPDGNPGISNMAPNLARHWVSCVLAALVAAWMLTGLAASSYGKRVLITAGLGLFAWLAVNVPYWNWYMFPSQFTIGAALDQIVGWAIAGLGMAWWLGRGKAA
jgi:hypothetical protein